MHEFAKTNAILRTHLEKEKRTVKAFNLHLENEWHLCALQICRCLLFPFNT